MAQRFVTDQKVEGIPALERLTQDEKVQALHDAERVYAYVRRSEGQREGFVPEEALRNWGEKNSLPPERMNPAIAVLQADGRLLAYAEASEPDQELTEIVTEGRQPAPDDPGNTVAAENDQRTKS
jgi:hypothetical protein